LLSWSVTSQWLKIDLLCPQTSSPSFSPPLLVITNPPCGFSAIAELLKSRNRSILCTALKCDHMKWTSSNGLLCLKWWKWGDGCAKCHSFVEWTYFMDGPLAVLLRSSWRDKITLKKRVKNAPKCSISCNKIKTFSGEGTPLPRPYPR